MARKIERKEKDSIPEPEVQTLPAPAPEVKPAASGKATVELSAPAAFGLRMLNDRIIYNDKWNVHITTIPPGSKVKVEISW
ncbi:MAG TPA: hypothetical protein PK082_04135 [Phycisphaerae bacterium]|nr:hypothetical protein [Phycisphaerae bacterium]